MKSDFTVYIMALFFILLHACILSCSGRPESKSRTPVDTVVTEPPLRIISMASPDVDAVYKLKDRIEVIIVNEKEHDQPDSVMVYFDGQIVEALKSAPWECHIPSSFTVSTGRKPVKAVAYKSRRSQVITRFVILHSDIAPGKHGFKVVRTFPHDVHAFTQGLFYKDGLLYEGTGQEAGSTLREVELETGKILRQLNLDPALFGEGITLFNDLIYQVTWRNKVGFVYDRSTFNVVKRIYYQSEAWGLTTVDNRIVMSDGSNILYFFEPDMFTVVSRLEVYDNEKKVDQINELEYINGEIWANIWQTDLIARIDPHTGRVNSFIDLTALFPERERMAIDADVLNGIAYDAENDRIFVTGKKWPKLYEIRIIE